MSDEGERWFTDQLALALGVDPDENTTFQDLLATTRDLLQEIDRLDRDLTMARLAAGFMAATAPQSTKQARDDLLRELLAWNRGQDRGLAAARTTHVRRQALTKPDPPADALQVIPQTRPPIPTDADPPADPADASQDATLMLSRSVDDLDLSVRAANCLDMAGIKTIGELVKQTEASLRRAAGSRRTTRQIEEELARVGLSLSPSLPPSPPSASRPRPKRSP